MAMRRPPIVVVLAVLTAVAMLAAAWLPLPTEAAWDTTFTLAALTALAGMLDARRNAAPGGRDRWGWWIAAAAAWLVGQLFWDLYGFTGFPASPNPADAGWYGFAALVIVGLLRAPGRSRGERIVAILEVLPLIAAAIALTYAQLWPDAVASSLTLKEQVAVLAYPALYVSAAILTVQAMIGGSLRRVTGPGPRLVLLGIAMQAVAFIAWSAQLLEGSYVMGATLIDPLWVAGLIVFGAGGALAGRRPVISAGVDDMSRRGAVLPAAMFLLLAADLIRAGFTEPLLGARVALAVALTTCGATLVFRTLLLERRLRVMLDRERASRDELAGREAELARLNERLREDSRRDALTGLRNRRALVADLPDVELDARRRGEPFALAIVDVDRFKAYNDMLGHLAGDQALRALATTIRMQLRAGDGAYRYGGEELVLVLRDAGPREALAAAERVRAAVHGAAIPHPADPEGVVTVSIGVASGKADSSSLLALADRALYEAKHAGRNCAKAAGTEEAELPARRRGDRAGEPLLKPLRHVLEISRAAAAGRGPLPVLEALAHAIRTGLGYQTVAVNLREQPEELRVVVVEGSEEARAALLGTVNTWESWERLLDAAHDRHGASWLPAGTHDWTGDLQTWSGYSSRALETDAWDGDDMLLLQLRSAAGEVLGVVSVDEPISGRRPSDEELEALTALAEHAALALERSMPAVSGESTELRLAAVMLLAETLDLRDAGTAEHSRTVGAFARDTAATLGLSGARVERLHAAGVLHDLGKLGIADAILHKPGGLDDAEWREMKRHPEIGARILEHAGLADIAVWVRAHHERPDGLGYPFGLSAAEIPLEARILAVADAYEAMIAERPYRSGMPASDARAELLRGAGTQFDAEIVDAFLRTLAAAPAAAAGS
jgi:diguanylate cyclase (GGDEF)-like protein